MKYNILRLSTIVLFSAVLAIPVSYAQQQEKDKPVQSSEVQKKDAFSMRQIQDKIRQFVRESKVKMRQMGQMMKDNRGKQKQQKLELREKQIRNKQKMQEIRQKMRDAKFQQRKVKDQVRENRAKLRDLR